MKKATELTLARKEKDKGSSQEDVSSTSRKVHEKESSAYSNIYTDTIRSLLEKNRSRVSTYYCANRACPVRFWDAKSGFQCPQCSSLGLISTFKADTAHESAKDRTVVGYLDSIGRIFCPACTERFGIGDDVGLVIYDDSEPYCSEACEACRSRLDSST